MVSIVRPSMKQASGHCRDLVMAQCDCGTCEHAVAPVYWRATAITFKTWPGRTIKGMVSCSRDIRLWDVQTGSCVRILDGHTDTIRSVRWSADGSQLLSASHDGTVRIWDAETGQCLHELEGHPVGVVTAVFSHDQRRVFSCDWKGSVRVWNLTEEKQKATAC